MTNKGQEWQACACWRSSHTTNSSKASALAETSRPPSLQSAKQSAITGKTSYGAASNRYPMKTFVQERFASLLLATGNYRVANLDPGHYAPIFSRMFDNTPETRRALQTCDWLKRQYRQTHDSSYLEMYFKVRQTIHYRAPIH